MLTYFNTSFLGYYVCNSMHASRAHKNGCCSLMHVWSRESSLVSCMLQYYWKQLNDRCSGYLVTRVVVLGCWVTCLGTSLQKKLVVSLPEKCVDVVTLCILTHSLKLTQGAIYYHSSLLWPDSLFPGHSLSPIFGHLQCKIVFAYCKQSKFGVREDLETRLLITWRSSYKPSN